jgi:hypothetical protein
MSASSGHPDGIDLVTPTEDGSAARNIVDRIPERVLSTDRQALDLDG